MFRFSTRDLLWLTLVIGMTLGWWVDNRRLGAEVDRASQRISKWRGAAGALEHALIEDGWDVEWHPELTRVYIDRWDERVQHQVIATACFKPSAGE
jgi:hypothetical protein